MWKVLAWISIVISIAHLRNIVPTIHNAKLRHTIRSLQTDCSSIDSLTDIDEDAFVSEPWFSLKQRTTSYQPEEQSYCVEATYSLNVGPLASLFGWDVTVNNYAEDANGKISEINFCAAIVREAQLFVAPCFLPYILFSFWVTANYWVIAFDQDLGYAIIATGPPTIDTGNGCQGTEGSGFWLFARTRTNTTEIINAAEAEAIEAGFNIANLTDYVTVDHSGCSDRS